MNQVNYLFAESSEKHHKGVHNHSRFLFRRYNITSVINDLESTNYIAVIVFVDVHLYNIDGLVKYLELLKEKKIPIIPINISPVHEDINILKTLQSGNPHLIPYLEKEYNDTAYADIITKILPVIKTRLTPNENLRS